MLAVVDKNDQNERVYRTPRYSTFPYHVKVLVKLAQSCNVRIEVIAQATANYGTAVFYKLQSEGLTPAHAAGALVRNQEFMQLMIAQTKTNLVRCRTSLFIRRDELMIIACWGKLSVARSEIIRNYWALIAKSGYGEHEIYAHRLNCTLTNQFRRVLRESEGSLGGITFQNRPFLLQMFGEQIRKFQHRLEDCQQQYLLHARDILEDPHSQDEIAIFLYWEMQYELQCHLSLVTQVDALLPTQAEHYAREVAAYDQQEGFAEYGQYSVERLFLQCWDWRDLEGCVTAVTVLRQMLTPPLARDYKNEFLTSEEITLSRPTLTYFERVLKIAQEFENAAIPFVTIEGFYKARSTVLASQVRLWELLLEPDN